MIRTALVALLCLAGLAGCVFRDVREQQARIDENCAIEGRVAGAGTEARPIVVVLAQRGPVGAASPGGWRIVDHFVLDGPGRWVFLAAPGTYGLAAFEDVNRDLVYQPGEPLLVPDATRPVDCAPRARVRDVALAIPAASTPVSAREIDVAALQARSLEGQIHATLGQLTAVGELAVLSEARFSQQIAESGLWRPFDFVVDGHAGVYFLEPYDPAKVPVLFVHGINGTPASFAYLVERLDRRRFQPWVYYYPSGVHIPAAAQHLDQTVAKLQLRYRVDRIAVVAHSMGGLVSRGFILRHAERAGAGRITPFITISSPWGGHRGADLALKTAPAVVRVWEDMAPGSAYLRSLFAQPLPAATPHHLFFTFNDQTITLASQLLPAAQANAERMHGFDESHMGVLVNAEVSKRVNALLERGR